MPARAVCILCLVLRLAAQSQQNPGVKAPASGTGIPSVTGTPGVAGTPGAKASPSGSKDVSDKVNLPPVSAGSNYTLGADDIILVQVRDADEISKQPIRIDGAGNISLPMAGGMKAAGLTPRELESQVADRLRHYIRDPQVVVSVVEQRSQPVSVLGAVRSPGVFQMPSQKTLIEVLSMAGGLKEDAGNTLLITRQVSRGPLPMKNARLDQTGKFQIGEIGITSVLNAKDPSENLLVEPHDVITVPEAQLVYVMGHVKKPGGFVVRDQEQVSALTALSMAEGPLVSAAPQHGRILRRQTGSTNRTQIPVDLRKVMSGKSADVPLEPGDILMVPDSLPKNAALRTLESAIQIGTGLVIWRR